MSSRGHKHQSIGIRVDDVSFAYAQNVVFENLSFEIPEGNIWALMGRSGIGKTTLLNVVTGLYRSTTGRISTASGSITGPGHIRGVVFREGSLLGWLTVVENVLFPHQWSRDSTRITRANRLLELAGLAEAHGLLPKHLSAGMYRRVELVRAILLDDRYIAADEPFTGLDVPTRIDLYQVWGAIQKENRRTGIICTHDPLEAAILCDSVLLMSRDGAGRVRIEQIQVPPEYRSERYVQEGLYSDPFFSRLLANMR